MNRCRYAFQAAMGGELPSARTLPETYGTEDGERMSCIISGVSNFILSDMAACDISFEVARKRARMLGLARHAESPETGDRESAQKLATLAALYHRRPVDAREMSVTGIADISALDLEIASELGYAVKPLGVIRPGEAGRLLVHAYPALVPNGHPLAAIAGARQAVLMEGSPSGSFLISEPVSNPWDGPVRSVKNMPGKERLPLAPIGGLISGNYLRFTLTDRPGAMGEIAGLLARYWISVDFAMQKSLPGRTGVTAVILTRPARDIEVREALGLISSMPFIIGKTQRMRIHV